MAYVKVDEKIAILKRFGLDPNDVQQWAQTVQAHRDGAKYRGLGTEITFETYIRKAAEAGVTKLDQIGSRSDQYNLCRYGDAGPYTNDSCRFDTSNQNRKEAIENGRLDAYRASLRGQTKETSEARRKQSMALAGRTKETHPGVEAQAATLQGRTKKNHPGRASQADKLARSFIATAPDGTVFESRNVTEFCQEHGLTPQLMASTLRGVQNHHKGWTGRYIESTQE